MRISVFGLGYVGCVSAACLARRGHEVIGVDVNSEKTGRINAGHSPIVDKNLDGILAAAVARGGLRATLSCAEAVAASEVSLVCVGTPGTPSGRPDLAFVGRVAQEIGEALREKGPSNHTVNLRSTVLPGTTEEFLIPALEAASGLRAGEGFRVAYNPEFLREGNAVEDFLDPPRTVVGASDPAAAEMVEALYRGLPGARIRTSIRTAEAVKYADNAFHALKIAFANEIGSLCHAEGIESHEVMEILLRDTKLNVAAAYLRPGFAFGGSCLPKDMRALVARARDRDLELPLLGAVLASNQAIVRRAAEFIQGLRRRKVGVLGLSFKAGTDDLRESPIVDLVERLLGKGFQLSIHDRDVLLARLVGTNKAYLEEHLPHVENLLRGDLDAVLRESEVLVIGNADPEYRRVADLASNRHVVVDLARLFDRRPPGLEGYRAIV